MSFPTRLPDSLRKALPKGVSLFPRPDKERWVMSRAPDWKQQTLPKEIVRPDAAAAYVVKFLGEKGENPGAELERRRVEGPTVAECAGKWLALLENDPRCAPATLKGHRTHVERWIKPAFGTMPVAGLDVLAVRTWLRKLRAEKKNARTVLHVVSSLRTLYGVAMAETWVNAPANLLRHDGVLAEMPEPEDDHPMRLPVATAQALIDCRAVLLERRARYALAFTSGMRDGEIAGVRLSLLDLESAQPTVRIEQSVALVGEKGPKGFAKPKAPKTKGSKRTLPLHPVAVAALREWLEVGWPLLVGRLPGPGDYLFPRPDGMPSRPRSADDMREDLVAAGLPDTHDGHPVTFKASRSSFLTWLDEAGVDERVRKRLAGHRASDVTERHYTARDLAQLASAVGTIELRWSPGDTVPPPVPGRHSDPHDLSGIEGAPGAGRTHDLRFRKTPSDVDAAVPAIGKGRRRRLKSTIRSGHVDSSGQTSSALTVSRALAGLAGLRGGWDAMEAALTGLDDGSDAPPSRGGR